MSASQGDLLPPRTSVSVLARTSVQVVLLVLVGSTGFLLSVVCTLLDLALPASRVAKAKRGNEGVRRERGQRQGTPSTSSHLPARRPRRQGTDSTVASSSSAASSSRGIDGSSSLPDLVFSTGTSGSSRTSSATSSSIGSLASVGSEAEHYQAALQSAPLVIEPPSPASSSSHERRAKIDNCSPQQQQQKKSRRCSLDLVRASLHIPTPTRSFSPPPTSRPSSISSCSELGDLLHPTSPTLGSRPKFGRLFSRASSAEKERDKHKATHLVEVSEGDEPASLSTTEQEQQELDGTTTRPKRRSSIRWSGFRSKGRRAVSEADGTLDAVPHSHSLWPLHVSDAQDKSSSHDEHGEQQEEPERPQSPRLPSSPRLSGFKSPIKSRLPSTGVSASPTKPSERRGRPCPRRAVSECISHSGSIASLTKKQQQSPPRPQQPNRHQLMAWSQHEHQRQEARNAGVSGIVHA